MEPEGSLSCLQEPQVRGPVSHFATRRFLTARSCQPLSQPQAGGPPLVCSPLQFIQYIHSYHPYQGRDSSVGIVTSYGLDDPCSRVRFRAEAGNSSLFHRVQIGLEPTQPPIQ
jgi:hypothetical protein